jgi:hypothetical protein
MTNTTMLIGGTGKTGRRVARRLTAQGVDVRIGSRRGTPPFDWADESTWAPVLDGVQAAYLTYYPDLAFPGAIEKIGGFAKLAASRRVEQLVLLSGRGEEVAEAGERAVQNAGTGWTIVSSSWFSQNLSEDFLLEPVLTGTLTGLLDGPRAGGAFLLRSVLDPPWSLRIQDRSPGGRHGGRGGPAGRLRHRVRAGRGVQAGARDQPAGVPASSGGHHGAHEIREEVSPRVVRLAPEAL